MAPRPDEVEPLPGDGEGDPLFVTAGHTVLFEPEQARCDACDAVLGDSEEETEGQGRGLYLWLRHGDIVFEEPPLCGACAAAITISALHRWEIEEEEG
jgi:hypothetical protein